MTPTTRWPSTSTKRSAACSPSWRRWWRRAAEHRRRRPAHAREPARRIGAQRRGYHLFHYLGHALPDRLILEDAQGRRDDRAAAGFTEILQTMSRPAARRVRGLRDGARRGDPCDARRRGAGGWRDLLEPRRPLRPGCCPDGGGHAGGAPLPHRAAVHALLLSRDCQRLFGGRAPCAWRAEPPGATATVGGDLLDWSVPVALRRRLEPGPLLPRSTSAPAAATRRRVDLKLGLQQRTDGSLRAICRCANPSMCLVDLRASGSSW